MSRSPALIRQWRWWLASAVVVMVVAAMVASRSDDVGSGGAVGATVETTATPDTSAIVGGGSDDAGDPTPATTPSPSRDVSPDPSPDASPAPPPTTPGEPGGPPPTTTAVEPTQPSPPSAPLRPSTTTRPTRPTTTSPPLRPTTTSPPTMPSPASPAAAPAAGLDALSMSSEAPRSGYERSLFPHWSDLDGNGCTTRQDMLFATVIGLPQVDLFDRCVIVEGDWYSVYDGVLHAGQPGDLDVDHVVALAEAWDSGAWAWDEATRRRFANDVDNLLVVTASSNRSKSDEDAASWRPPRRDSWCLMATIVVQVKARYGLSVDSAERRALVDMLGTCDDPGAIVAPTAPPQLVVPPRADPVPAPNTTAVAAGPAPAPGSCIDLNTASTAQLQDIIHIGPARAAEIVSLRPFASVADLDRVSGIGPSRLSDIVEQGLVCP